MKGNFLEELNESQRMAVEYCDGPSLVIAGAGSGKTRVLTYKIAYLIDHEGYYPWEILALTFTNKAANEMKSRIGNLIGEEQARYIHMGTFHSIFSRILRVEAESIGYSSNFTIYDENDSRSLLKSIIKEMQLNDKVYKPATVHHYISMAKNHIILPQQYAADRSAMQRDHEMHMPAMSNIYTAYCERCRKANAMDFDDLLTYTFIMLRENSDIREKYSERFRYVLVDEYQDTNSVQQQIVLMLASRHSHVCAVGDDAQSIYGFRGANIDNILDFRQMFEDVRLFKLEQNYRSTQRIVKAANSLIKHNERQIPKDVFSKNAEGDKLILKQSYSDKEEALIVCNDIMRIRRTDNCEYSDFAILYRTNSQSRSFEESMRKMNIPYKIYGGLSFYQRKEIKDIIAYFRLVANPSDEEAFKRIINYPKRGIGDTTVGRIIGTATDKGASLWDVISAPQLYGLDVSKGTLAKIEKFKILINGYIERAANEDAYTLGKYIIESSGIANEINSDNSPEGMSRQENVNEFTGGLEEFVESRREEDRGGETSISDFLQEVSLLTDLDSDNNDNHNYVSLMTVHSAKGLEFPNVFIVGMEENIFPNQMCMGSKREMEEERRLLYVAITRAERHCILTCAKNRFRYGKLEFGTPSRFLSDIDPSLISMERADEGYFGGNHSRNTATTFGSSRYQNSRPVASQFRSDPQRRIVQHREEPATDPFSNSFKKLLRTQGSGQRHIPSPSPVPPHPVQPATKATTAPGTINEGNIIEHERFGIGSVIRVEGTGENTKATVQFKNAGTKQLLLKFARFKVIG